MIKVNNRKEQTNYLKNLKCECGGNLSELEKFHKYIDCRHLDIYKLFCDKCNTRKELVFDIDLYFTKEYLETFNKFYKKGTTPNINLFELDEIKDIEHIFLYFVPLTPAYLN